MAQHPSQYVYILHNKYCPFVYKIGKTTRTPKERAKEISRDTGSPGDWEVGHYWETEDCSWLEQRIFTQFKFHRISARNEHFEFKGYSVEQVAKMISEFININGVSPKEEARKAEERRKIERQKREREKELEQQRLWREQQRAEQARLEQQQLEARNAECNRLTREIKLLANRRIKQETPLFASKIKKQCIQDKYFKYLNVPFDLDQLRSLKEELNALQFSKNKEEALNLSLPQSNQNSENQRALFWVLLSVGGFIFMLSIALDENEKNTLAQPTVVNKTPVKEEVATQPSIPSINAQQSQETPTEVIGQMPQTKLKETHTTQQKNSVKSQQLSAEQVHFNTIFTVHPDAVRIVESTQFRNWINKQSPNQQNYYNNVLNNGTATQVIDMFTQYKKDSRSSQIIQQTISPSPQSNKLTSQDIYETYQKPLIPSPDKPLEILPAENMVDLSN
ncbi:GIY-YIG nuclease family protein [Acinetobacter bereziniae]|uniref:GIY-YIG nuclease family protein n=1 Tax=Acinetobacter bereziniae TaxID=106648 RepID=UPI002FD93C86